MVGENLLSASVTQALEKTGGPLDVGEEEGDSAGWETRHEIPSRVKVGVQ